MRKMLSTVGAAALLASATWAIAETSPQTPTPPPQSMPQVRCTPGETDLLNLQLDALKGMRSSVGHTARDFCAALDKTEDHAMKDDDGLLADVLALIKKHSGADVDIKTISRMCKANQEVPGKALDEQIAALEKAKLACQEPI